VDCGQMNDCAIRLPSEDDKWPSFKKSLQEGARPVCRICRSRMYLGENGNEGTVQVPSDI